MTTPTPPGLRLRDDLAVALLLAVLAFALSLSGLLWRADRLVYDAALSWWGRPAAEDVVIVAIDDASVEAIGRWPWRRAVHATLLERLAAARPRAIVLDLLLSEPDPDPRQDALLAAALRHAQPVLMPVSWQAAPGEARWLLEPVPVLRAAAAGLGAAEAAVDDDGVLRHAFLEAGPPRQRYPHLAAAALRAAGQAVAPGLAVLRDGGDAQAPGPGDWRREGRFLIRYDGPPGQVRRVSYADVLAGTVPASVFAGRFVFVGMTAQGLGDTVATPVNAGHHAMPGVEVLVHVLNTLRRGDAPHAPSPWTAGLLSGLSAAALVAGFARAGTRAALLLAMAALPAALLLSLGLMGWPQGGLWWGPASFLCAAVLAYPLWSWRRLERGVAVLDREIARLGLEPGLLAPPAAADAPPARDRLGQRLAALHQAAGTLRSARRFLADALAGLPTAMLVDDGAGRVLLANPPAARLYEIESPAEMQGLDLARLLAEFAADPPPDWPAALAEVRRSGQALVVPVRMEGHGDHLVQVDAAAMSGGTRLVVAIADIGPVRQAEREREEMLAFVSHDLRSPAIAITLLADQQLAGRGTLAPEALMREMRRLAERTQSLADDFVRVAQAAQRPLQCVPVVPAALLAEALADFRPQAEAAGAVLHIAEPASEAPVAMDRALVLRAVGNLLSNAIRHSPVGARVDLRAVATPAGGVAFGIADQGPGLPADALQRLAGRQQGLVPRDGRGVGFGLLFVQRVAARHGGLLRARPGEGGRGLLAELEIAPQAGAAGAVGPMGAAGARGSGIP